MDKTGNDVYINLTLRFNRYSNMLSDTLWCRLNGVYKTWNGEQWIDALKEVPRYE